MKVFAVAVLSVFLAAGLLTAPVLAQTTDAPAGAQQPSESQMKQDGAQDAGAALPRAATDQTTIFGLTPTAAVILAAALLMVVILAIIAMTRSSDTYIDTNRRL